MIRQLVQSTLLMGLRYRSVLASILLLGLPAVAPAQQYWNTNGVTNTLTAANWSASPTGPFTSAFSQNADIIFGANSVITNATTNVGNITVNGAFNARWIASGTLGTNGTVRTFSVASGGVLDLANVSLSTAAGTGFIKSGDGILFSSNGNTYAGGFTLNAGMVIVGGVNAMGGGTTATLLINGGTIAANATRDLTNKYGGGITVGGDFTLGGVTTGVNSGNAIAAANLTFSNTMNFGTATRAITIGGTGVYLFGGAITGAANTGLTINGTAAGVIALSGLNTYDGGTTINSGILTFRNTNARPVTGTTTVAAAGTLGLGVGAAGFFAAADVDSLFANTLANVSMHANAAVGIDTTSANFTYATSQATANGLTKIGINTLFLTGANTYSGNTTILGGTLSLGDGITNGSVTSNIINNATVSFNVPAATSTSYSGTISGTGNLTKVGNGTLTLSGNNSYAGGTVVSAGVLIVSGTSNLGNGSFNAVGTASVPAALRMSSGTVNLSGTAPAMIVGNTGVQGNMEISGTAMINITHTDNTGSMRMSARKGGVMYLSGGAINVNYVPAVSALILAGTEFIVGNAGNDRAVVYASGGTLTMNTNSLTGSALVVGDTTTANGGSDLTITGSADWTLNGSAGFVRMTRAGSQAGNLNLTNGGRLTTRGFVSGGGNSKRVNFDGGTLRAGISSTTFLTGMDSARIYSNGATIDSNSFDITISQALLAPTGDVVMSIPIALDVNMQPLGGSGYICAPIVSIIEGSGATANVSATAIANYDAALGTVTSITITNPGANFTAPTVTLSGGTSGTPATLGAVVLTAAPTTGGLTKLGLGTLTLSGANTYGGTTTINAGTIALSGVAATLGASTAPLTMNGGGLDLGTLSIPVGALSVTAPATSGNTIANGSLTAPSFAFSNTTGNVIVTASLLDNGTSPLTKTGAGTLTLSGVNTYAGATTLSGGSLIVLGQLNGGGAISVAGLTTLGGTGTATGIATIAANGIVEAGQNGSGKLTLGGLSFSGIGTINFGTLANYFNDVGVNITAAGGLVTTGANSVTITVASLNGALEDVPYKLIGYSTSIGGTGFPAFKLGTLPSRAVGELSNIGSEIQLTITDFDFIKWTGTGNLASGWNTSTLNWKLDSDNSPTAYINSPPDVVVFDDSVSVANTGVIINTTPVSPNSVTFDNTIRDYTLQGDSGITGGTGLTKTGAGKVTIENINSYTGITAINGGTITFASGSLGTGFIKFGGGTLQYALGNSQDVSARIKNSSTVMAIDTGNNGVTFATALDINNTAGLAKSGIGSLTLAAANTYPGNTSVSNGTLILSTGNDRLPVATTLTLGDAVLNTSGNFKLDGRNQTLAGLLTAGTGTDNRVINGNATAATLTLNIAATNEFAGILGGSGTNDNNFSLAKTDVGTLTLTNANTYANATNIGGGILALSGGNNRLPVTTTVAFTGTSTLDLGTISQTVGNVTSANAITGSVTGTGTLTVSGNAFQIGGSTPSSTQTLNLAGLTNFVYLSPTTDYSVGGTSNATSASVGVQTLAVNNTITALSFNAGHGVGSSLPSGHNAGTINLGQTNIINANTIGISDVNRTLGTLVFQALESPSLTIRATDGTGRANMIVGQNGSGSNAPGGVVDLTANLTNSSNSTLNAMIGTLLIGSNNRGSIAGSALGAFGSFTMGGGSLDATSITIGLDTAGTGASAGGSVATGTFTLGITGGVAGGTVKVTTLTLGDRNGTSTVTGTFNLNNGGTLAAQTIQPGAGTATRTVNWNDGIITTYNVVTNLTIGTGLTMKLADTGAHTFLIGASLTGTVNALLADATTLGTLNKTGAGTLILKNANTYTGTTTIAAGTLSLADSGSIATSPLVVVGTSVGSTAKLSGNALDGGANYNGTHFTLAAGQTLAGHGTVDASLVPFASPAGTTIAPGTSAGTLTITGNATLGGSYNFEMATAGTGSATPIANGATLLASNDVIAISGTADVTGLVINIASIDTPATGFDNTKYYSWTILTSTGLNGSPTLGTISGMEFSNAPAEGFSLVTANNNIYLNFSNPVPEPTWLLLVGICGFFAYRSFIDFRTA